MKKLIQKIKCAVFGHDWRILAVGQNWPACSNLHPFADTRHKCQKCSLERNWIHTDPERLIIMAQKGII